jgi:hypothetical protein
MPFQELLRYRALLLYAAPTLCGLLVLLLLLLLGGNTHSPVKIGIIVAFVLLTLITAAAACVYEVRRRWRAPQDAGQEEVDFESSSSSSDISITCESSGEEQLVAVVKTE